MPKKPVGHDPNDPFSLSDKQVLERIESLTAGLMGFWKNVKGWAPAEAAKILKGAMLEWQTSLATSLKRWVRCKSEGDLILAWTNLGSLAEGALKLFLCAYLLDYLSSSATSIEKKGKKKGKTEAEIQELKAKINAPDGIALEALKVFFAEHIWDNMAEPHLYLANLQMRRNAVHAFQKKEIGTFADFKGSIRQHLILLRRLNDMLPYPDEMYRPVEKGWLVQSSHHGLSEPVILERGRGLRTTTVTRNNKVVLHKVEVIELSDMPKEKEQ
jgi:hypothetical protein